MSASASKKARKPSPEAAALRNKKRRDQRAAAKVTPKATVVKKTKKVTKKSKKEKVLAIADLHRPVKKTFGQHIIVGPVTGKTLPFVVKESYLSIGMPGRPFQMTSAHPMFEQLADVLRNGQFDEVPKLVLTAEGLANRTAGKVTFEKGVISYEGTEVHSTLASYICKLADEGKDVAKFVLFMDNLYKNPSKDSITELFDFLTRGLTGNEPVPITDDGCFLVYKAVRADFKDCHTGTINNEPGQVVMMPRKRVDDNRRNECSNGLHVCRRSYLNNFGSGGKVMEVKVNPKDVVSIPQDYNSAKMRVAEYEVLRELTKDTERSVIETEGHKRMNQSMVEVFKERQELLAAVLAHSNIKRNIRDGKIAETTIRKMTFGRLEKLYDSLPKKEEKKAAVPSGPFTTAPQGALHGNPLRASREAAGLSIKQMAEALDITTSSVYKTEKKDTVTQAAFDSWMIAIQELTETKAAVSFPKPVYSRITMGKARGVFDALNTAAPVAQ